MTVNFAHCLFEQSGTFKKEFISLGIPAKDYDLCNEMRFVEDNYGIDRSLISPDYAHNFICDHILGKESGHTIPTLF